MCSFKPSITIKLSIIVMILAVSVGNIYAKTNKYSIGFSGVLGMGTDDGTALDYWGGEPYESSYGFGLNIEYFVNESFHIFLDANYYTMKTFQGSEGETVYSPWVFEQSGYTDGNLLLDNDIYYYMDTTMFRLGGKYLYSISEKTDAWYGAGVGFCGWKASYMTSDRTGTYGSDSDFLFAPFYLMFGVDYKFSENMKLAFFFDGGSPVADVKIDDLFQSGWTWESSKHIMAPYRIGLTFSSTL